MTQIKLGDDFYYGITLDDELGYDEYIQTFLSDEVPKAIEYKTKLVLIEADEPNKGQLCYTLEILENITTDDSPMRLKSRNKVGDHVYAYNYYDNCDLENKTIGIDPQCVINDGGGLNCSGMYRSLVIPWSKVEPTLIFIDKSPVKIIVKTIKSKFRYVPDNNLIKEIGLYLDNTDDFDGGEKYLYRRGDYFGFIQDNKFIQLNQSEYSKLALFFCDNLK